MSAISSMTRRIPTGVWLAALMTTQLPAARAGASFQAAIRMGKFQGMICPTTPNGSCTSIETVSASRSQTSPASPRITLPK